MNEHTRFLSPKGRVLAHLSRFINPDTPVRTLLDVIEHPSFIRALLTKNESKILEMLRPILAKPESELYLALWDRPFIVAVRRYLRDVGTGKAAISPLNQVQ